MRIIALAPIVLLVACSQQSAPTYQKIQGQTMGTSYHITFELPKGTEAMTVQQAIDKRLNEINQSMSTYIENSTISKFNRLKAGETIVIDPDFIQVLNDSRIVYQASHGSFDPTIYPLVELWGFGKTLSVERLQNPPSETEVNAAKNKIGLEKVILEGDKLSKTVDGVGLDFSAIAKGYGVDVIAQEIKKYGINNYMVEIGGEVITSGVNDKGKPWTLAIDKPTVGSTTENREILTTVQLSNQGMATSGNYRNIMTWNNVHYSHTIDPSTYYPVANGVPSVTVISSTTAIADAWATALTAVPQDKAIQLAENNHIKAIIVTTTNHKQFDLHYTTAYKQSLKQS